VTLLLVTGALALPSLGLASGGGAGLKKSGGSGSDDRMGVVHSGDSTVSASGDGVTIATRASGFLKAEMRFTGSVPDAAAHDVVEIERLGHETRWAWRPTAHAAVRSDGSFTVIWRVNHIGRFKFRALVERPRSGHVAAASPSVTATVYKFALATQYGPGFYGSRTACGETLKSRTLGVAHRTLPCGTHVELYYHGRTIVVAVIDRGPYANGADWDLTEATGRALRMDGTATIGAVSLPGR
jgi:hypothetical protein